jgi:serine/threonine-protein kinase RsbW
VRFAVTRNDPQSRISLTVPAKPEYLIVCRLALTGLVEAAPIGDEALSDLKLAVTEACANAVSHAYENGEGAITMRIDLLDDWIRIEVADDGRGIAELAPVPEDGAGNAAEADGVAGLEEGGMGIALIGALVDELQISSGREGRGTRVVFTKRIVRD